ncbi:DUF4199 domain-containing protein [Arundinibacter roseus]|uniref:DUF4199 domain-containing protein n=1 Tax=Arundinibacter roseus TaxID=2070510 RepID=A0A4R4KEC1_9BACT|nr:DUF4199 domain-containing protein [Arundinibacter roseus]TDB65076.1 DUF4199 domain-containing protein [Arundinibacter roseus]
MKTEFKYAALLTVSLFLWLCFEFWIGFHDAFVDFLPLTSALTILIWGVLLFLEIKEKQNLPGNSVRTYGKGFRTAFLTTVLAVPMLLLTRWVFYDLINPDFFNNIVIKGREWISVSAKTEDNFNNSVKMMEDFFKMKNYQTIVLVLNIAVGLLFSLILPLFTRKKSA